VYECDAWSFTLREKQRLRVFENRVMRKVSGQKRNEVTGQWTRRHEKLYDLYSSLYIIPVIKSRRDGRGTLLVWGTGELHTGVLWGYLMKRNHSEDLGVNGRAILT